MKKTLNVVAFLLLVSSTAFATYSTDWIKQADNTQKQGSMIARDISNNVIVTGYIQSNGIYTRKYDKFGNLLWEKSSSSGIQSLYERSIWVNTDASKNVFVVGCQYAGTSNTTASAVVVLKYNAAGTLLWKKITPVVFINVQGFSFNLRSEVDASGNLYVGTASMDRPGFVLIKYSPTGAIVFNKSLSSGGMFGFGSMRLKGNKVVLTGRGPGLTAAVVAWNTSGTLLYSTTVVGHFGDDVEIDDNGNAFILTSFANQVSATSGEDMLIYKLNATGALTWTRKYDFGGTDFPTRFTLVANRLSVIGTNRLAAGGYSDWITFQTNMSGTKLWSSRYDGPVSNDEYPNFIAAKTNGEVFVTGVGGPTPTPFTSSNMRMITLKYGNTGATQWVDSLSIYNGWGLACTLASDGSLFVLSSTRTTAYHFLDHTGTGSCGLVSAATASNITNTQADITWPIATGAYLYHLRYKPSGATIWSVISTNLTSKTLTDLTPGTNYDFALEAICTNGPSGYNATQGFATNGVGYCTTSGQSQAQEYLNFVWIGGINHFTTALPTAGYSDYTTLSTNLVQGTSNPGYVSGLVAYPDDESYRIWIDFNQDNDFTDAGELVVDLYNNNTGWIAFSIAVPATAPLGATRMRITQSHDVAPAPCGIYPRGETQDYTVVIVSALNGAAETRSTINVEPLEVSIFPNPFSDKITIHLPDNISTAVSVSLFDMTGKLLHSNQMQDSSSELDWSDLSNGVYIVNLKSQDGQFEKTVKVVKQ